MIPIDPAATGISKAIERLRAIRDEISSLQTEASEIDGALSVLRRYGTMVPIELTAAPQDEAQSAQEETGSAPTMSQAEFEVIAHQIIEEAGRPLTRSQIIQRFADAGKPITGDASKNAGTKLWRAKEKFVNIRGAGYWLRDRPLPALGYTPDTITPEQDYDPDFPKPAPEHSERDKATETAE